MAFEIQIRSEATNDEWCSVRPSGGKPPYRYPTRGQARNMMRICYPDQVREVRLGGEPSVRIVEVSEPANTEYECPPSFEVGDSDYDY
jgi:hypothetical protein